jgi:hypothetical protein
MSELTDSILLIGEYGAGKTHYGAQLLKRLMKGDGQLKMHGAATNLEPFESTLRCLDEGIAGEHTPSGTYLDSVWPVIDDQGRQASLVWPDYGGEQVKEMTALRRMPPQWKSRIENARVWILLLRLQLLQVSDDIFTRSLRELKTSRSEPDHVSPSDQARLIELLQMCLYVRGILGHSPIQQPKLMILLTCWDELKSDSAPQATLRKRLPMLTDFATSNWANPYVLGVSALERPLDSRQHDPDYVARGPENFGYVIQHDGTRSSDLTLPIRMLLADAVVRSESR